jgi:phosphoribosylaminoimidazolecarboxamide formyltransferase/IMP cyclohydrolase
VIGFNRAVDEETARECAKTFIEAIAAPDYSPEALAVLRGEEEPAPDARSAGPEFAGGEIDLRRVSGADRR